MEKDIEQHRVIAHGNGLCVELIFKPEWQPGKLSEAELQLLLAYKDEILREIEEEEKAISEVENARQS